MEAETPLASRMPAWRCGPRKHWTWREGQALHTPVDTAFHAAFAKPHPGLLQEGRASLATGVTRKAGEVTPGEVAPLSK